ncbi:hypothetical protein quinque_004454 [Culex quinquefasciatus]
MAQQTGVELKREYVWDGLHRSCVDALHGQIKKEFDASIVYLKLGRHHRIVRSGGCPEEGAGSPSAFVCEGGKNDYHLVDYLTGEYVDEQHKGQRELAEKIATLRKMTDSDDAPKEGRKLAEFLFDKNHM